MPVSSNIDVAMAGKSARGVFSEAVGYKMHSDSDDIAVGQAVQRNDTDSDEVEKFDGSGDFLGVAAYSLEANQDYAKDSTTEDRAYYDGDYPVKVVRTTSEGAIVVKTEADVSAGDDVYVTDATADFTSAEYSGTATKLTHAEYASDATADSYVAIRLRPKE